VPTSLDDRRDGSPVRAIKRIAVQEIIARTTLDEIREDGSCAVCVHIELCLSDGQRVQAREEDGMRIEVDTANALSARAAVTSAVRAHVRTSMADRSARDWPAFQALGRFGGRWTDEQRDSVRISVDIAADRITRDAA
jgi:hypothetical protein